MDLVKCFGRKKLTPKKGAKEKLPSTQKFSHGVGHILNDLVANAWFSYLIIYLTKVAGLSNSYTGYVAMSGQVIDGICTPITAMINDKTVCRSAKRHQRCSQTRLLHQHRWTFPVWLGMHANQSSITDSGNFPKRQRASGIECDKVSGNDISCIPKVKTSESGYCLLFIIIYDFAFKNDYILPCWHSEITAHNLT